MSMRTEGKLPQLRHEQTVLTQKANELNERMTQAKFRRVALGKESTSASDDRLIELQRERRAVEEELGSLNVRMTAVQRDSVATAVEIGRNEGEVARLVERIQQLRRDVARSARPRMGGTFPLTMNLATGLSSDLQEAEARYVALVGEQPPLEAA